MLKQVVARWESRGRLRSSSSTRRETGRSKIVASSRQWFIKTTEFRARCRGLELHGNSQVHAPPVLELGEWTWRMVYQPAALLRRTLSLGIRCGRTAASTTTFAVSTNRGCQSIRREIRGRIDWQPRCVRHQRMLVVDAPSAPPIPERKGYAEESLPADTPVTGPRPLTEFRYRSACDSGCHWQFGPRASSSPRNSLS